RVRVSLRTVVALLSTALVFAGCGSEQSNPPAPRPAQADTTSSDLYGWVRAHDAASKSIVPVTDEIDAAQRAMESGNRAEAAKFVDRALKANREGEAAFRKAVSKYAEPMHTSYGDTSANADEARFATFDAFE